MQGFTGSPDHQKREEFIISKSWKKIDPAAEELVYYIEMACNRYRWLIDTQIKQQNTKYIFKLHSMFGAGKGGMIGKQLNILYFLYLVEF